MKDSKSINIKNVGPAWHPDDLVKKAEDLENHLITSGRLRRRIDRRAGLEGVRFHDLRHTFASLMLLRGAKPKVISEALGHSSVAFTMDTYSHIIEGMQSDAMALLDEVLPDGANGARKNNANLTPTFRDLASVASVAQG